ncbi:hypothetical protein UVI_02048210 [Ustilaginoidea virens]|uniref:C2H2-type domain-containing protein n=1 Tax=Ustilaginoidea virens TaxID=1159556 RepID=A0A1B5KZD2_USTVR|nr:hypothetical protein UVI_02048210 [Ustilaginoidea virens]
MVPTYVVHTISSIRRRSETRPVSTSLFCRVHPTNMTMAAGQHQLQSRLPVDTYDPDDVVPRGSPLMKALHPKLEPSPSPPPDIPPSQIRPNIGDAVLLASLDNGRRPEIARAGYRALPGIDEEEEDGSTGDLPRLCSTGKSPSHPSSKCFAARSTGHMTGPSLQHRAADSLQAVSTDSKPSSVPGESPDIALSARQLSLSDERVPSSAYRLASKDSTHQNAISEISNKSPIVMLTPSSSGLPPLQMDSPKFESNGHSLPSIRSTLGDIDSIPPEPPTPADQDLSTLHGSGAHFTRSPPVAMRCLPPMSTSQLSPPISPNETFQLSLPSPHSLPGSSNYNSYASNGLNHQPGREHVAGVSSETPNTEQSALTPATSTSVADRMSIDGITNPSIGLYICKYAGCRAPPFQTQYLLNSHANVHSSARPHYCPVPGCPRSEGGKGFKRKNEMIRHGLVHDSPGYICPFCPDREHKYPRPDNLQRHVRVHHTDKDKDDPMLREVLSQRSDGPSRGRRRRGGVAV